jgi:hypothetical protein
VPKIYHKLRKVQLRSDAPIGATNKHLDAAHHVEAALVAFFTREFLAQLNRHPLFRQAPVALGHVHLATTLIRVELKRESSQPLVLAFEQRAGWIIAAIEEMGWAAHLPAAQSRQLAAALLGLYKLAGVDLIHEQLQSLFPAGSRFDFRRNDLIVWPDAEFAVEGAYDLTADGRLTPRFAEPGVAGELPALRPGQVLFRKAQVPREGWIELWETDAGGAVLADVEVFPPAMASAAERGAGVEVVRAI